MISHIHEALGHVQELRARILESQEFRGYSGRARMLGAFIALAAGFMLSSSSFPQTELAHVVAWGVVCLLAAAVNYMPLVRWYQLQKTEQAHISLRPVLDSLIPLLVGGVLTLGALLRNETDILFGIWMTLFGLAHVIARQSLPKALWYLGCYYITCGSLFLVQLPGTPITNPWPMAIVFFTGELMGGCIFLKQQIKQ